MATSDDLRAISAAELGARITALQQRAFARYEEAAHRGDHEADATAAARHYADAEADCAPWIAEAKALNDERVRRLQARARRWWAITAAVLVAGVVALAWLLR